MQILALNLGLRNVARHQRLTYADARMRDLLLVLLHLVVTVVRLCGPGGVRAVIAENLVLKQQLIVLRRGRRRAPNLTWGDRLFCGFGSLFLNPGVGLELPILALNRAFGNVARRQTPALR